MDVHLVVHLDRTDEGALVWWAEVPEFPGFSAAADSLPELQARARLAIEEILAGQGEELRGLFVELAPTQPLSDNPASGGPQSSSGTEGVESRAIVSVA